MLEMWVNGHLLGYFKCPKGYTPQEWAEQYNENRRTIYDPVDASGDVIRMRPL